MVFIPADARAKSRHNLFVNLPITGQKTFNQ